MTAAQRLEVGVGQRRQGAAQEGDLVEQSCCFGQAREDMGTGSLAGLAGQGRQEIGEL